MQASAKRRSAAQLVSVEIARELDGGSPGLLHSSACPTSVDFIRKYLPELAGRITPVASPLIAHCRLLRDTFGENIRTIFIGPCIAKKNESDRHPGLLISALTYPELRQLFREEGIDPARVTPRAEDSFVPEAAEEGARYPIEGGMNDTIAFQTRNRKVHYVTLSGTRKHRPCAFRDQGTAEGRNGFCRNARMSRRLCPWSLRGT